MAWKRGLSGVICTVRVTAINDEGDSDPLTTTHAVLSEDLCGISLNMG